MNPIPVTLPAMAGLVGDIGGTWARFGLVGRDGTLGQVEVGECRDHAGLAEALDAYLRDAGQGIRPQQAAISVACPVLGDRVRLTNHPWSFSIEAIRQRFGFERMTVINDFSAVARAVPLLGDADRMQIGGGRPAAGAAIAVLGPGTGLGVSGLVPAGDGWAVIEGEGGHATMAAASRREEQVLAEVGREFGHVSAERVLSGPGLVNLHRALCRLDGKPPGNPGPSPREILASGVEGRSPRCREVLDLAAELLGTFAADLALTLGARGGVYIGGGLMPRCAHRFAESGFRSRFENKGRFSEYLSNTPTYLILHDFSALLGLAALVCGPPRAPGRTGAG